MDEKRTIELTFLEHRYLLKLIANDLESREKDYRHAHAYGSHEYTDSEIAIADSLFDKCR